MKENSVATHWCKVIKKKKNEMLKKEEMSKTSYIYLRVK